MAKKNLAGSEKSRKVTTPPSATTDSSNHVTECSFGENGLSKEEKMKRYDKYRSCGDFEKDLNELCSLLDIQICVRHRAKLQCASLRAECDLTRTKDDKKHSSSCFKEICKVTDGVEDMPLTYAVTDNDYDYFKPRVEIECESDGYKEYIKGVYIRGWKVDLNFIDVLAKTIPDLDRITVLDMWNVGLNDETIASLGKCVALSSSLKTLSLDGNSAVTEQRFDIFLRQNDKNCLQNFSLRNCDLNEIGAMHIGDSLSSNVSLLTLNLCFNKIGDIGAQHLANSLRMNRTLLSLNLGCNVIGDEGVKHISSAISTFPLTHEQIIAKRMKMSDLSAESFPPVKRDSLLATPPSIRSQSGKVKEKDKAALKKRDSQKSRDSGSRRDRLSSETLKVQKVQKPKSPLKVEITKSPIQVEDGFDFLNPLLENTREINGELWIPGNRSLINLNLSRNRVTNIGLEYVYHAVNYQVELARESNRVNGTGIMRICMQNNRIDLENSTYVALQALLRSRDPIRKTSSGDELLAQ